MTDSTNLATHHYLCLAIWRIGQVRDICIASIAHDKSTENSGGWTDRHWLAQSVLNIFDGKIDEQYEALINGERTQQ